MKLPWILLAVATLAIILMIWFWPSGDSEVLKQREEAYKNQIALLQLEKDSIKALQSKIILEVSEERKSDSVKLAAKDSQIRVLKTRIAKSRQEVQPMIDTIPTLSRFVEQQDSLIQVQDSTIAIYQQSLYDLGRQFTVLEGTIYDSRAVEQRIQQECESRRAELLDQIERLQKKPRSFWTRVKQALTHGGAYGLGYLHGKSSG
jgi:chromosome segregation ATPase